MEKKILLAFICLKEKPYSPSDINTEWKFLIEFLKCLRRNVVKAYFDTYCVQYLHAMPFLNFFFRIFTLKNVYIWLLFRKVSSSNCHIFTKICFLIIPHAHPVFLKYETICAICYHLYNSKNVKNTHGRVILFVKFHAKTCNFTKSVTLPWVFFTFSWIVQMVWNRIQMVVQTLATVIIDMSLKKVKI